MNFHDKVPEEVAFYRLFPYVDFHELIRVIPHVCSVWRKLIIEKLETLHLYPNVDLDCMDSLQPIKNSNDDVNQNIQLNMLPFVRYVIKFVKSNGMNIRHLLINGQVEDIVCRKQFRFLNTFDKFFIANRSQRETVEFRKRLAGLGNYFPNTLSEPALRRLSLPDSTQYSCYDRLDELMDSETFKILLQVCRNVEFVSLSNLMAKRSLTDLLCKAKIVVVDNTIVEYINSVHFNYSFFTNGFVPFGSYSSDYTDLFPVESEIFYTSCKNIRLPPMTINEFQQFFYKTIVDKDNESVEININQNELYTQVNESEIQQALHNICDYLAYSPYLKRLTFGFGFVKSFKGRLTSFNYKSVGRKIEDLYLRDIGYAFSTIKLDSFISGFENLKFLVLENIKSTDCHLVRDSLSRISNLTTIKLSFYDHDSSEDASKYFDIIATLVANHKKLTKLLFEFPYMDGIENESALISTLDVPSRKCSISLKRLPYLSKETITKLKTIPLLDYKIKPTIENDSHLFEIDYDQDIETIIERRKSLREALQNTEILCPSCLKLLTRHSLHKHIANHHTMSDFDTMKHIALATCPCCKVEYPKKELEEHLLTCPDRNVKIKMHSIKDMNPLTRVYMSGLDNIKYPPDHPIPIYYPPHIQQLQHHW